MKRNFSIVLKPDATSSREIRKIMKDISKKYGTYAAFRDQKGPHASFIYMDEKIDDKDIAKIISNIKAKFSYIRPFEVSINGVTSFRRQYQGSTNWVVYLRVVKSKSMTKLYRVINHEIKSYKNGKFKAFTPHITIARKDIDKDTFFKILREYRGRDISYKFTLRYLYAMKRRTKKEKYKIVKLRLDG